MTGSFKYQIGIALFVMGLISMLVFPAKAFCEQPHLVKPDSEKRSSIHEADGFAYLAEDKTMSELRKEAFACAKRQAVEMARTFIQSKTSVENFVLKLDEINSSAEGIVTILEQKDLGVEDNSRYHVWIKAEVEYHLKPTSGKDAPSACYMDRKAPLTVNIWTGKKHYKSGENVTIFLQGNKNFYARVVDVTFNGNIIQLLPNDYRTDNFFKADTLYNIPNKADQFQLEASPPFGKDKIIVYASENPLGNVQTSSIAKGLRSFSGSEAALATQSRGISIKKIQSSRPLQADQAVQPPAGAEFYEATWAFETNN